MSYPIKLSFNPNWINKDTRPECKYAPVVVDKEQSPGAVFIMQNVLDVRIRTCQKLALMRGPQIDECAWFSFIRGAPSHEPHLKPSNVPIIVISGGSANKIKQEIDGKEILAWHPGFARNEPVYLLVHKLDYRTYASALSNVLGTYRNFHLIGWDGGALTGFGAARTAALAFADTLPYRPQRILMMDQDVVQTDATRPTKPKVQSKVTHLHETTGKPIIGYGVGYPTRQEVPKPFDKTPKPIATEYNSPAQQFVSITAPFRKKRVDGIYPAYMVAGGEDMLMGLKLELTTELKPRNVALLEKRIFKKDLKGPADNPNIYWNEARVATLEQLYSVECNIDVEVQGQTMRLGDLLNIFHRKGWINSPAEGYNVSACIVERIILRLHKMDKFPPEHNDTVFNRFQSKD
ncbi:hypothetical protein [Acidithiobacillus ferrivorans]|nr:hypothetical protein [Acidithiobacillus ferrivorans]